MEAVRRPILPGREVTVNLLHSDGNCWQERLRGRLGWWEPLTVIQVSLCPLRIRCRRPGNAKFSSGPFAHLVRLPSTGCTASEALGGHDCWTGKVESSSSSSIPSMSRSESASPSASSAPGSASRNSSNSGGTSGGCNVRAFQKQGYTAHKSTSNLSVCHVSAWLKMLPDLFHNKQYTHAIAIN